MDKMLRTCEFCGQKESIENEYWYYELEVNAVLKFRDEIMNNQIRPNYNEHHVICEDCFNHMKKK